MRLRLLAFLLVPVALACGGGAAPDPVEPTQPPPPADVPARPAPTVGSAADAELAGRWLVILGSKKEAAEAIPGVAALARHPEIPTTIRQISSSRFKNLMPCYAVTIAAAEADKKAALDLSKRLTAVGVDNYVKNAGAWIGPSAAIDAYCARGEGAGSDDLRALAQVGDTLWLPLDVPAEVAANLIGAAPAPVAMNDAFDAWKQPIAGVVPGVATGAGFRAVDAASGRTLTCTTGPVAALTLGTPHFGVLQGEGPPKAPACGEPALYAALTCDQPAGEGTWLAAAEATPPTAYTRIGEAPELVEAAKGWLTRRTDWEADPEGAEGEVTREVTVTRWKGPLGEVALVEGRRLAGEGVCGGDEQAWSAMFAMEGGALGVLVGDFLQTGFGGAVGIVGVHNGPPGLVTRAFPGDVTVTAPDGSVLAAASEAYCDCAC